MDRQGLRFELLQHDLQLAFGNGPGDLIGDDVRDADACDGGIDRGLRRVDVEATRRTHGQGGAAALAWKNARGIAVQRREGDAGEVDEIGKLLRHTVPGEVFRASDDNAAHSADPGGYHAAVGQGTDPHRHVDVVLRKIDVPVGQRHPDVDVRVRLQEVVDDPEHMEATEGGGRCKYELAGGCIVFTRRDRPGGGYVGGNTFRRTEKGGSRLRQ